MKCLWLLLLCSVSLISGDTPAHCIFEDVLGTWSFYETDRLQDNSINCDSVDSVTYVKNFTLEYPNIVRDEIGNVGTWTLIYNQGFEININERSYFAYSYYEGDFTDATSFCDQTFNGWARDKTLRNWSCFKTEKHQKGLPKRITRPMLKNPDEYFKNDYEFIKSINSVQNSWIARSYPEFEKYTLKEMSQRAGGPRVVTERGVYPAEASQFLKAQVKLFPQHFDWRDRNGVNYISDVRDQGGCGSCYAFASMANLEANIRIATRNDRQDVFSTQDPVSCSYLDQGCNGGFDYLIAGRYAMEQGVVAESCNPYTGTDTTCVTDTTCSRTYVSSYDHVGGYYGACNEELMIQKLVTHGPISVSFMVYDDFHQYGGGIYHHTEVRGDFNPFEITNHVVLIVGYGQDDQSGEKYWIVKNSWGKSWGEDGYFRIRRGTDECAIESMAVYVTVVP